MGRNFLNNYIKNIQNEYLELLKKIKNKINTDDYFYIIDEINVFWISYINIIQLYFSTISREDDTYIFTGASYLDINDLEHYPFVIMGKIHVIDDPLCKYSKVFNNIEDEVFANKLKSQIIGSVEANIKILEEYSSYFLILPFKMLSDDKMDIISEQAISIFLSMFSQDNLTLDIFFYKFKTIQDIIDGLKPNIDKSIVFEEDDDINKSLDKRFKAYLKNERFTISNFKTEAHIFFSIILGFIYQALEIIYNCFNYNMIPYLRYNVTFNYVILLSSNFYNITGVKDIIFKSQIAHIIYLIFDKSKFKNTTFYEFSDKIKKYNISDQIENSISQDNITMENISVKYMINIFKDHISKCFN